MDVTRPDVTVHVDTLVLDGVAPGDRARVADGVARELGRLLASGSLPGTGRRPRHIGRLSGAAIALPVAAAPEHVGARIAASVHGALTARRGR